MTSVDAARGAEPAPAPTSTSARTIAAGLVGNMLEWYDFSVYGYYAAAIGAAFFPKADPVAQILAAFGVFAVGYVMRPLGGLAMGYVGDHFGRKTALTVSITAMVIPTFLVGVLPDYAVIGIAAPVILTLLRVFQGIAIGGEYATSMVFLVENAPPARRGLMGATVSCAAGLGILLGSGTGALLATLLPADFMAHWGWRIPFLFGLVAGVVGVIIRRHVHEAPMKRVTRLSISATLRNHLPLLLRFGGLCCFIAVFFYLVFLYVVSWLQFADGVSPAHALGINTWAMAMLIPFGLLVGWMSDRIGRRKLMLAATLLGLVCSMPLFWLMHHRDPAFILLAQFGFVIITALYDGVLPAALVESTPADVRCTLVAVGYNVPMGVIGGLTPLTAEWLIHRTHDDLSPAWMLVAASAISLIALLFHRETYREKLERVATV